MKITRNGVAALLSVFLVCLASPLVMAAQHEKPELVKECTMQDMHKCMMNCTACCEKNMKSTAEAMVLLDEAVKAMDTGKAADAKLKIEKAKLILKDIQAAQKQCIKKMPTAMDRCPMTGKKIDLMDTPENQIRLFKGKKIGFCCPACPPLWDKLTEQDKDQMLEKMMSEQPTQKDLLKRKPDSLKTKEPDSLKTKEKDVKSY